MSAHCPLLGSFAIKGNPEEFRFYRACCLSRRLTSVTEAENYLPTITEQLILTVFQCHLIYKSQQWVEFGPWACVHTLAPWLLRASKLKPANPKAFPNGHLHRRGSLAWPWSVYLSCPLSSLLWSINSTSLGAPSLLFTTPDTELKMRPSTV